jgi:hypothetical protein
MNSDSVDRFLDRAEHALLGSYEERRGSETAFLRRLLSDLGCRISAPGLSPAELSRAFLYDRPLMHNAREVLEILALPSQRPERMLRQGDWMLRAVPGSGDVGHVAVLASADLLAQAALATAGIAAESLQPGHYGSVIEAGAFPHSRAEPFARRWLDTRGRVPPHTVLLRPKYSDLDTMPDFLEDEDAGRYYAPPVTEESPDSRSANASERARTLAQMLHDGKRPNVLLAVQALVPEALDALEKAIIGALSNDKNRDQAIALRGIIRFVRRGPTPPVGDAKFGVRGGNTVRTIQGNDKVYVTTRGIVTFRTKVDVDAGSAGSSNEAYWLTYRGPAATDMHWLQFIWRMVELPDEVRGGKTRKVKMRINNLDSVPYHLTTDVAKLQWTVDTTTKNPPFYDEFAKRSSDVFEMIDFPSPLPSLSMAIDYFDHLTSPTGERLQSAPKSMIAHFGAATYLIDGLDVLYRADIHLRWTFTSSIPPPVEVLPQDTKTQRADKLESAHRACLALQYPDFDYLPGQPIGPPLPIDAFDLVPDLGPMNWDDKAKKDPERYAEIAALAHAELINDVGPLSMQASTIHSVTDDVTVGNKGLLPGLNHTPKLSDQGQTGYLDADLVYRGKVLPTDRYSPLPKVAIKLGESAFNLGAVRDKAFALGTMRHEMTHATHDQLTIGWLLKWRDELTSMTFKDWLRKQRITELDFALISTGLGESEDPTQLLAWTEGFVTGLPFLPAPAWKNDITLILKEADWPGAITELAGVGKFFKKVTSQTIRNAALNRIHDAICDPVAQAKRATLIEWIQYLQNPKFPKNPTAKEQQAINLFNSSFPRSNQELFTQVVAKVNEPCPK